VDPREEMTTMTTTRTAEELSAPLGSANAGHLVFTIGTDRSMDDLYRARFDGRVPTVRTDGDTVTVAYRFSFRPARGEITLSGRIPWAIRAHMGMSDVVADLEDVELSDLEISGGASRIEVRLPRPKDAVRIRIGGGASDIDLIRPTGVPVRVRIGAGTSKLAVDDYRLEAGRKTDWRSPDYDVTDGRYDIEIGAGASKVTVGT
jgi:hypothetical protein